VASIRDAVVLVGLARLQSWMVLIAMNPGRGQSERISSSARPDSAFTLGLLHGVAEALGMSPEAFVAGLPALADDMKAALIGDSGPLRTVLYSVLAYELADLEWLSWDPGRGEGIAAATCRPWPGRRPRWPGSTSVGDMPDQPPSSLVPQPWCCCSCADSPPALPVRTQLLIPRSASPGAPGAGGAASGAGDGGVLDSGEGCAGAAGAAGPGRSRAAVVSAGEPSRPRSWSRWPVMLSR
jgi:hypothetical protein